jgi:hypothetical protein
VAKGYKDAMPHETGIEQEKINAKGCQVAPRDVPGACRTKWGCQAVVAKTVFGAVIAMDLLEHGLWKCVGVFGPEAFEPVPFMQMLAEYGFPYGIRET